MTTETPKQVKNEAGFIAQTMEISKRVAKPGEKGENVKVGDVAYFVPELEAFGVQGPEQDSLDDDGLPIYKDARHNWLYAAVLNAVKVNIRNKLVSGTASWKEGATAPTNLEALMAEGQGQTGEALKRIAELKRKWAEWVAGLKKSSAAEKMLRGYFASADNLALQTQTNKDKFLAYLTDFIGTQEEGYLVSNQRYLDSLLTACKSDVAADDF